MSEVIVPGDPNLELEVPPATLQPRLVIDWEEALKNAARLPEIIDRLEGSQRGHRVEGTHSHSQLGGTAR